MNDTASRGAWIVFLWTVLVVVPMSVMTAAERTGQRAVHETTSDDLSAGDFLLRGQSTMQWWRDRDRYGAAVLAASRSPDPETAQRANWILRRWRCGILPGTPDELAVALAELEPAEAIELLLESSRFADAVVALTESRGTMEFNAIGQRLSVAMDARFPVYVRAAHRRGTMADFLKFVDAACFTPEQAVARARLLATVNLPPGPNGQMLSGPMPSAPMPSAPMPSAPMPSASADWAPSTLRETRCLLALIDGRAKDALAAADSPTTPDDRIENRPLRRVVQMLLGRWDDVANEAAADATRLKQRLADGPAALGDDGFAGSDSFESARLQMVRHWVDALMASRRCENKELYQRSVAALADASVLSPDERADDFDAPDESATEAMLRWRSLMLAGEVDAAIAILAKLDPIDAASVAFSLSRFEFGFELLGYPFESADVELNDWIQSATAQQAQHPQIPEGTSRLSPQVRGLMKLMDGYLKIGRDDLAWRIASGLSQQNVMAGVFEVREHVLLQVAGLSRVDWARKLAMPAHADQPSERSLTSLSRLLLVDDQRLIESLMKVAELETPGCSPREQFEFACDLAIEGQLPPEPLADGLVAVSRRLSDGTLRRALQRREYVYTSAMLPMASWISFFQASGRPDLAAPWIQELARRGDPDAIFTWIQNMPPGRPSAEEPDWLESIWTSMQSDSISRIRSGNRVSTLPAVKATIEQIKHARKWGDEQSANEWTVELKLMACSPSTDVRRVIADALAELGHIEDADSLYRELLLTTAIASDETQSLTEITRGYEQFVDTYITPPEPDAVDTLLHHVGPWRGVTYTESMLAARGDVLDWWTLAFSGTLDSVDFYSTAYVSIPLLLAHQKLDLIALQCLDSTRRDSPQFRRQVQSTLATIATLQPTDITMAEGTLPRLRDRGFGDEADAAMAGIINAAKDHLRKFPHDAMLANNVAWSAAMNGRHLDEALDLSRRAVSTEPDSAIFRDTLAELLGRIGQWDQAVAIEQACVLDDPGQWHLHQQIERFERLGSR